MPTKRKTNPDKKNEELEPITDAEDSADDAGGDAAKGRPRARYACVLDSRGRPTCGPLIGTEEAREMLLAHSGNAIVDRAIEVAEAVLGGDAIEDGEQAKPAAAETSEEPSLAPKSEP